jgi:LacI family repressor for deo operon, udp, cdd, tsx, nupC, and nupG
MIPALTTVRQPRAEIGRLATRALIDILERDGPCHAPIRIVPPTELVIRESATPPVCP